MTNWYQLTTEEIEKELKTDLHTGLEQKEAEARLISSGPNKIYEAKTESLLVIFLRQFGSPLILILLSTSLLLFAMKEIIDGILIIAVLVFNAIVGTIQEGKSQNTLAALKNFVQTNATALRDGKEIIVPDTEIIIGDVVMLQEGEKVPADARIVEINNLSVEEAALTGESTPVHKTKDIIGQPNLPVPEQKNMVFKGTHIVSGNGKAIVTATGFNTVVGKISETIKLIDTEIPLKANMRYLSHALILVISVVLTILFVSGIIAGRPAIEMFKVAVSLAVSIIPEGLPIVMTIVLVGGVWRMAKRNALVKRLQAVEALGQAKIIAVDKTGTITKNEMEVADIFIDGKRFTLDSAGYDPKGEIKLNGQTIDPANHSELILAGKIAAFCASAHIAFSEETRIFKVSGDPTEAALIVAAQKIGIHKPIIEEESPKIYEFPFSFQTKYHVASHKVGEKQFISVTGAPETLFSLSNKILKNGGIVSFTQTDKEKMEETMTEMLQDGVRMVAFASAEIPLDHKISEVDIPSLTFLGFYGIKDTIRPEAKDAVQKAREAGIKVVMITGDHKITAKAIAKEVGIYREGDEILLGDEIEMLFDAELSRKLSKTTVFARVTPEHKLRIIQAYKKRGEIVAMTGDGINDAPSLVAADLGVAMGKIGTEVTKEAADIVLLDDNFGSIVNAIEEGRNIYKTIKKVILYLFSTSAGEVLLISITIFAGYPLPLFAGQIIWLNFVTDGFLDVALAMEPKESGLLSKTFEHQKKYLVDKLMLQRMIVMALPMSVGSFFLFMSYVDDLPKAMTVALTSLAVFQWFNAWNCKSEDKSIFKTSLFSNIYLTLATLTVISLQILAIYTPFMRDILKTVPLGWKDWVVIIIVALSIIAAEEIRKFIYRIKNKESKIIRNSSDQIMDFN